MGVRGRCQRKGEKTPTRIVESNSQLCHFCMLTNTVAFFVSVKNCKSLIGGSKKSWISVKPSSPSLHFLLGSPLCQRSCALTFADMEWSIIHRFHSFKDQPMYSFFFFFAEICPQLMNFIFKSEKNKISDISNIYKYNLKGFSFQDMLVKK